MEYDGFEIKIGDYYNLNSVCIHITRLENALNRNYENKYRFILKDPNIKEIINNDYIIYFGKVSISILSYSRSSVITHKVSLINAYNVGIVSNDNSLNIRDYELGNKHYTSLRFIYKYIARINFNRYFL